MTEATPTKKQIGLPPGRCIHPSTRRKPHVSSRRPRASVGLQRDQRSCVLELSELERVGPLTRLTFTIPQTIDGKPHRAVVARLLVPTDNLPAMAIAMREAPHGKRERSGVKDKVANVISTGITEAAAKVGELLIKKVSEIKSIY